jgi:hypothetical protein
MTRSIRSFSKRSGKSTRLRASTLELECDLWETPYMADKQFAPIAAIS